ncbi:MAG: hypothetical protein HOH43_22190 [Candidatus Latescibacteria bacterium]|jgi:cytochrome c-type biogenesis protein CcmH/NrfF|nr:hypothetical protein [Candidatus Latescibacterota bacterium]
MTKLSITLAVLFLCGTLAWSTPSVGAITKAEVKDISGELICYCGCASKVVATCGCGTADHIEEDIEKDLESGKTKDQIIAAYLATHGEQGLATPIASGFNLSAWAIPILMFCVGGAVIRSALVQWHRKGVDGQPASAPENEPKRVSQSETRRRDQILNDIQDME